MTALDNLRERGVLSDLDWHFAHAVGRIGGESRAAVRLAAALASRAVGQGHVCLDLRRLVQGGGLADEAGVAVPCEWPSLAEWTHALGASPLVASPGVGAVTPLVLDDAGRLYLRRYWEHQTRLAEAIRARAGEEDTGFDGACLADGLQRLFPGADRAPAEPDWQRIAAVVAVLRRFCVISGGPGTGKTHTVVRILALLIEQALHAGRCPPRVTLLAPTGKAAARLTESIRAGKQGLPCSAAVVAAIPDAAATIHRGLGAVPGRSTQYRYGADNPLLADVVLVDEASMVDVALMARLVEAMPPAARLILLGDQDQLASVEAGAVLGDICNSGVPHGFSPPFEAALQAATDTDRTGVPAARRAPGAGAGGSALHLAPAATGREAGAIPEAGATPAAGATQGPSGGLRDCIVELRHSYRYRPDSGIGRLARAINAGDVDGALAALAEDGAVGRVDPAPDATLGPALVRAVCDGFAPYVAANDPLDRLRALGRFRVLCAHRRGPHGLETVNAQIERLLADTGCIRPDVPFYAGRPILITRNDYQLQLFNGDVGTIADDPDRPGVRVAVFLAPDGTPRRIAPSRLPPHETVFAMSAHKSQGSEFDAVAVLLPLQPSPIVSRELLYTAVTRARARATVYATAEMVAHAVTHRTERASGLRDALWAPQ